MRSTWPTCKSALTRPPARLKRWTALNALVREKNLYGDIKDDGTDRKRQRRDLNCRIAPSDVSWADVAAILQPVLVERQPQQKQHDQKQPSNLTSSANTQLGSDKKVATLHTRLSQLHVVFGDIVTGNEAKRRYFVSCVLETVCNMYGDTKILLEEDFKAKSVRVGGQFQFVLQRGNKRVAIMMVNAPRTAFDQEGIAQLVVGLEAWCDAEQLPVAYGIVTNYLDWVLVIDQDDAIQTHRFTLTGSGSVPTIDLLNDLVSSIYEMLQ